MRVLKIISYTLLIGLVALLLFGVFISRYDLQLRKNLLPSRHAKYFDYRGITHAVTNYSQGSAPPGEMLESASQAQVDFIYITDLNDFDSSHEIFGYNDNVLVFTGKKLSLLDSHFLLYSQNSLSKIDSFNAAQTLTNDFINRLPSEAEAVTVVMAHPFKPGHAWNLEYPPGLNGIEVINLRHMWQQIWLHKKVSFTWSLFLSLFNPKIALLRLINEPLEELQLWEKLNLKRKTLGFLGNHSTGKIFGIGKLSFSFPTYEDSFRFGSNHVLLTSELTGIPSRDLEKVHTAIRTGNFYFSIDALANPKGFAAYMTSSGRDYLMGSMVPLSKELMLKVDLPLLNVNDYEVKVYKDGSEFENSRKPTSEFKITSKGNYRVYVRLRLQLPIPGELRWIPWIYTNHFYVR